MSSAAWWTGSWTRIRTRAPDVTARDAASRKPAAAARIPGSQRCRLTSVATSWQHPYRPICPMRPESGRYGRSRRRWTYLHFLYKVEGLVDHLVRGGSSPLKRIEGAAADGIGFSADEATMRRVAAFSGRARPCPPTHRGGRHAAPSVARRVSRAASAGPRGWGPAAPGAHWRPPARGFARPRRPERTSRSAASGPHETPGTP